MGCCQHDQAKPETKPEGKCCGGASKSECPLTNAITGFFRKLFGKKCCGSEKCTPAKAAD